MIDIFPGRPKPRRMIEADCTSQTYDDETRPDLQLNEEMKVLLTPRDNVPHEGVC